MTVLWHGLVVDSWGDRLACEYFAIPIIGKSPLFLAPKTHCSTRNAMYWTHASVDDIDSWGELGNEGWSWNDLLPYYLKSEKFDAPSPKVAADLEITSQNLNLSVHGESGLLINGYPEVYDSLLESWPQTYSNLGLAVDGDPRSGNATGGYIATHAVDPTTETRSYAGNKYLKPALQRSNLKILTGAHVNKIIFASSSQGGQNGAKPNASREWC